MKEFQKYLDPEYPFFKQIIGGNHVDKEHAGTKRLVA
jgi:hypothetical protein